MKTFPCRKSLSFQTTSLGRRTQQIPSLCLVNVNRKNKRRLRRVAAAGNIWLNPHSANHCNMDFFKNADTRQQPDLFPPLRLQFQEFYEWKMSGDRFSIAAMALSHELTMLLWWVPAVWSSDAKGQDPWNPPLPLYILLFGLTDKNIQVGKAETSEIIAELVGGPHLLFFFFFQSRTIFLWFLDC